MTRDDVIRMAREAGLWPTSSTVDLLERFSALVAAAEREACARVCDEFDACDPIYIAAAIRARGEK